MSGAGEYRPASAGPVLVDRAAKKFNKNGDMYFTVC
jgi:hypothetical protein